MTHRLCLFSLCLLAVPPFLAPADDKKKDQPAPEWGPLKDGDDPRDVRALRRKGQKTPLFVGNAPENGRPYVHPIQAPDGKGELTEFSPGHHKHQTGLYVGFVKVNGRDFFHNRGKEYFHRKLAAHSADAHDGRAYSQWQPRYHLLDKDGNALLQEEQIWRIYDRDDHLVLDLDLLLTAQQDVTLGKYDY